jgi:hypothetical protein
MLSTKNGSEAPQAWLNNRAAGHDLVRRARADILEDILGYFVHLLHRSDKYYNRFGYRIFRDFAAN